MAGFGDTDWLLPSSGFLRLRLLLLFSVFNIYANHFDCPTKFGKLGCRDYLFWIFLKIVRVALHPDCHVMDRFQRWQDRSYWLLYGSRIDYSADYYVVVHMPISNRKALFATGNSLDS